MTRFDIPPDSPLVDGRDEKDVFSWVHAVIILGMHAAAVVGLFHVSAAAIAAFAVTHAAFLFGLPLCFHKLLAHRTYQAPVWVTNTLATFGTLAFQGGPLLWAATHRAHHRQTDEPGDAHASIRGFWWSHMGWTFYKRPNGFRYREAKALIPDLIRSAYLRFLDRRALHLNLAVLFLTAVLIRRLDILLWAFPVRIVVDWHITWLVNSYAHRAPLAGTRKHAGIRNSPVLAILAFGEGWHANHHQYPGRANFGHSWWQIDPAYWTLRALQGIGLVRLRRENVRRKLGMARLSVE